jgi:branched-chain amino acid transport system permease protein
MVAISPATPSLVAEPLRPARPVDLRRAIRLGLVAGVMGVFVCSIGMVLRFQGRIIVADLGFGYVVLGGLTLLIAYLASASPPRLQGFEAPAPGARNLLAGVIAGAFAAAVMTTFLAFVGNVDVRDIFLNVSEPMIEIVTFGRGLGPGILVMAGWSVALGVVAGVLHLLPQLARREVIVAAASVVLGALLESVVSPILREVGLTSLITRLYDASALKPAGAVVVAGVCVAVDMALVRRRAVFRARMQAMRPTARNRLRWLLIALGLLALGALPQILGQFLTAVANLAGVFMLMALGLNIVVGFAGLLDLGYVAFFLVGAYATGVLTSPASPGFSPEMVFLLAVPFVVIIGVLAGIFVGAPVLRMRGDYLAIVTLGFGEIARLLAVSDWLRGTLGGAQGITRIPNIAIGPFVLDSPQEFFYAVYGLAVVAIYVSYALQNSRMGRAWVAMREDESVAEAMGINVVAAKLWAFVLGAALASLGGALYASTIHSIFPASFGIQQSILLLIIVIVGGLGSVPGVVLGALVLVAMPELLREFEEFRFLIYGALLILMMLRRPEGLIPSRRRALELHEEDRAQDEWLQARVEDAAGTPEPYRQPHEI